MPDAVQSISRGRTTLYVYDQYKTSGYFRLGGSETKTWYSPEYEEFISGGNLKD